MYMLLVFQLVCFVLMMLMAVRYEQIILVWSGEYIISSHLKANLFS